jgi:acetyl esterase/lipase
MKQMVMGMVMAGLLCSGAMGAAEERPVIELWPDGAPGALGQADQDKPTIQVYHPTSDSAGGTAVVICPGGGYSGLAMDHEGRQIAEWFNSVGVTAFILKYRLPARGYRHPFPLMDAQRAIRLVRARAEEWKINPDRIGILGFSAGGHLASTAATHFNQPVPTGENADAIDAVSCRPDFQILIYPVISMDPAIVHRGSRNNLLGPEPAEELLRLVSNELQITAQTPPAFLVHANDDKGVLPENSIRYYLGLRQANVPAELHIFLKGGHGFGMRPSAGPAAGWPALCRQWLEQMGF